MVQLEFFTLVGAACTMFEIYIMAVTLKVFSALFLHVEILPLLTCMMNCKAINLQVQKLQM